MDYTFEVAILPVSDVDRALDFYTDKAGFVLDIDYRPGEDFRVVQLTPAGSACSVQFGIGLTDAPAGSARGMYLLVRDIEAARSELVARGVDVGPVRHKEPAGDWRGGWGSGVDPARTDYASFAEFADPDGNGWVLQERGFGRS